jgi:GntR family transcriptional repressor for pyruvate dehydrogenase complex
VKGFKPIRTRRLYEEILEQMKELLAGGELKPGDKLMSERELAERLEVSRPSVREAIRSLEMMGFVEIRRGGGTYVRNTRADEIIRPLAMFLAVERSSQLEMFEVRRIFEAATARLAAERATGDDVEAIRAALEAMSESVNARDSAKGEGHDIAFHYAVAEATHNALLTKLFRTISEDFSRSVSVARRQLYVGTLGPGKIIEQHRRIFRAIRDHDPDAAASAMLAHLGYAERELRKHLTGIAGGS